MISEYVVVLDYLPASLPCQCRRHSELLDGRRPCRHRVSSYEPCVQIQGLSAKCKGCREGCTSENRFPWACASSRAVLAIVLWEHAWASRSNPNWRRSGKEHESMVEQQGSATVQQIWFANKRSAPREAIQICGNAKDLGSKGSTSGSGTSPGCPRGSRVYRSDPGDPRSGLAKRSSGLGPLQSLEGTVRVSFSTASGLWLRLGV